MKNGPFLLLALVIGLFCLYDSVGAVVAYDDYNLSLSRLRQSNGTLTIYVWRDGDWQSRGSLTLDKYYREKNVQLDLADNPDDKVRVKLIQNGGGSAHIDAASLGGRSAVALVPETPSGLAKLAARDFDVLHGFDHAVELVFNNPDPQDLFSITARIEAERLDHIPFQLPLTNLYKKLSPESQFWTYPFDSQRGTLDDNYPLDFIGRSAPFFKEFLKAGSGHPSDYVYGWVLNDDDNLYVIMDLTGDNTMDGEKDYAKVYVNTSDGVKAFKITQSHNQWGKPYFIYTDKVTYQHKVYTFRIPLEDIGLNPTEMDNSLDLAFAAYGTLAPPPFSKTFSPSTIGFGSVSTLTFTIVNGDPLNSLGALDFTDNLPAGVTVANPANASTTCTGGTLTATTGTGVISYTGGTVNANSSCTIQADVTSSSLGTHLNTTGDLTSSSGNSGTASDTLVVVPRPVFSKAFVPGSIFVDETSKLTFTIDNSASALAATILDFTDNLPAGVTVANPANASTTCTGGTLTATTGTGVISYTGGTVNAGASCTVQSDVTSGSSGAHLNTTGDLTSSFGTSGTASDTLVVVPQPVFTKAFVPGSISVDGTSTLTFTIDNTASMEDVTNLDFTDNLPMLVTVANPANVFTTCPGGTLIAVSESGTISYTGGTVTAGSTCTLSVDVTSNEAGIYTNITWDLTSSAGNSGRSSDILTVKEEFPWWSFWSSIMKGIHDKNQTP